MMSSEILNDRIAKHRRRGGINDPKFRTSEIPVITISDSSSDGCSDGEDFEDVFGKAKDPFSTLGNPIHTVQNSPNGSPVKRIKNTNDVDTGNSIASAPKAKRLHLSPPENVESEGNVSPATSGNYRPENQEELISDEIEILDSSTHVDYTARPLSNQQNEPNDKIEDDDYDQCGANPLSGYGYSNSNADHIQTNAHSLESNISGYDLLALPFLSESDAPSSLVENISYTHHPESEYSQQYSKLGVYSINDFMRVYEGVDSLKKKWGKKFNYFNKTLWDFFHRNLQNNETYNWKQNIRRKIEIVTSKVFPGSCLLAVGSTVNGCGSYNSDMDLCLSMGSASLPSKDPDRIKIHAKRNLKKLGRELSSLNIINQIELIPAKVPILKISFNPPFNSLDVDINLNNRAGIYNSHLIYHYTRIDDRFPALCLIIKAWAKLADINDAASGTFNSYSLILMVIHFLQCGTSPPILPNLQLLYKDFFAFGNKIIEDSFFENLPSPLPEMEVNTRTLGELLIAFFEYYCHFPFESRAISIKRGHTFGRGTLSMNTRRFKIYIQEPYENENTARCVTDHENFAFIIGALRNARTKFLAQSKRPPSLTYLKIWVPKKLEIVSYKHFESEIKQNGNKEVSRKRKHH